MEVKGHFRKYTKHDKANLQAWTAAREIELKNQRKLSVEELEQAKKLLWPSQIPVIHMSNIQECICKVCKS